MSFRKYVLSLATLGALASTPAAAVTLTVASFPSFDGGVKLAIERYKKLHPEVTIKLVSLSFNDHHNAMTTALATSSGLPDVMGLEIQYIGKFAESAGLEDLSKAPFNSAALTGKLHAFAVEQGKDLAGAQIAVPADIGVGTLFYRPDLLDKAGVKLEDMTKSWDAFIESGKRIREKTGAYVLAHCSDLFSIYIRTNVKPGEGLYFDEKGQSLLNTPRFKRAFELAAAARKAGIDANIGTWTSEWREAFKRDQLATQMNGAWLVGHMSTWLHPEGAGKWRSAQLPEGAYAAWGGAFYSIPKKATNKKEAMEFIRFMVSDKAIQQEVFRKIGSYPALRDAQDKAFLAEPVEYLGGQKARSIWADAAVHIPVSHADRYDQTAAEIIGSALDDVIESGKDVSKALAEADEKLKRRVRRR